jgi:ADP-ribose pyrophosphatase YjhB (NUDIX family)
MSYQISEGVPEDSLATWLTNASKKYGVFDDGRVNYKDADTAPIVMCTVMYKGKVLIAKRGYGLADAEGYWSSVNGFIDEVKPIKDQVKQEINEELSIVVSDDLIKVGKSYTLSNPKEKRSYIVFPCLVSLTEEPKVVLNEENTDFAWIERKDLKSYHILDDLEYAIDSALKLQ